MRQKWIYRCKNIKTGTILWLLQPCNGWRVLDKEPYYFTESGTC